MRNYYRSLQHYATLEKDDKYLMIHRIKKKHDVNKDKWIGIGGKLSGGEPGGLHFKGDEGGDRPDTHKL